jgi:chemotaxis protein histidine kinase CheA
MELEGKSQIFHGRKGIIMSEISNNSALNSYAADYSYRTEYNRKTDNNKKTDGTKEMDKTAKKSRVSGRTIGDPVLSDKAKKYYEQLKAKYSNMDFILVSPEQKEEAESKKGMYQSSKELIVLIDSDKIEKMAEDEEYRTKYEGILSNATSQLSQMKDSLGSKADSVSSFGMTFDDNGNASFFAVVDKSLAAQKERIADKKEAAAEEKKKAQKKTQEKRAEERKADRADKNKKMDSADKTNSKEKSSDADKVTVSASSWEELLKKIDNIIYESRADSVLTKEEKAVGQSFDYSI